MIDIRMLGGFEVTVRGEIVHLASKPAQLLLAYLSLTKGSLHRREHLAALLWPDADEVNARQNLRNALYKVNRELGPGLVAADKASAGIPTDAPVTTDVEQLEKADDLDTLASALDLVRGELLPGLLEEWVLRERERVAALVDHKAEILIDRLTERRDWQACIRWSERWIALGRVPEAGYRALMRAHAARGDSAAALAAFERLAKILDDEYGIDPASETLELHAAIRAGRVPVSPNRVPATPAVPPELGDGHDPSHRSPPRFGAAPPPAPFWGRSQEIARLLDAYRRSVVGDTRLALVTGEAGQGKTRLLHALAERLADETPSPLVTIGRCAAFGGVGQPYLPFRDVVAQLLGEVEEVVREHGLPVSQAERLWTNAPRLTATLSQTAATGLARMLGPPPQEARDRHAGGDEPAGSVAQGFTDRGQVFDSIASLLDEASKVGPLVVMLDDLHWADEASTALLFHLARRLGGRRILFVGAFRTEELKGWAGPFAAMIGELERLYGDIRIDLTPTDGGQAFVDAAVDAEPNRLGPSFRASLASLTNGNGLFTVELLEEMRSRGGLVRDDDGSWREGADLDWSALPARVEGIIRTRLSRLDPGVRELLEIASVVGGRFEAEAVAAVTDLPARNVIASLRTVAREHLMVEPSGTDRTETGRVSRFRFRHDLFHRYLYRSLGEGDRAYLHEAVGHALEAIYAPHLESVSARLAHHFAEGGVPDKASRYLLESGLHAMRLGAYVEAERTLRDALGWVARMPPAAERASHELRAMLALGGSLQASRGYADPDADAAFQRARELAHSSRDRPGAFQATWSIWAHAMQRADIPRARSLADDMFRQATGIDGNPPYLLQAHHALWFTALCEGRFAASLAHAEQGIALETAMPSDMQMLAFGGHDAGICARLYAGRALWFLGRPAEARHRVEEAIALASGFEQPSSLAHAHAFAAEVLGLCSDVDSALAHSFRAISIAESHGLAHWRAYATILQGCAYGIEGDTGKAIEALVRGMDAYRSHEGSLELPVFLGRLADLYLRAGRLPDAEAALVEALARAARTGEHRWDAELHRLSGVLASSSGQPWEATRPHFERAIEIAGAQGSPVLAERAATSMRNAAPDELHASEASLGAENSGG